MKKMKTFLYEWMKYSVIFAVFSFTYTILMKCTIGVYTFGSQLKDQLDQMSSTYLILHEILNMLSFYNMTLYLFVMHRCNSGAHPFFCIFFNDYRYTSEIVIVAINSLVYGGIIYGVKQTADVLKKSK
jgi:hypothetical protein